MGITIGTTLSTTGMSDPPRRRTRPIDARRAVAVGLAGVVVAALSGCGLVVPDAETPRASLTMDEAPAALRDYDARNNRAIEKSSTPEGAALWKAADTGLNLKTDLFSTRFERTMLSVGTAKERKQVTGGGSGGLTHTPKEVYAGPASVPTSVLVRADRAVKDAGADRVGKQPKGGTLLTLVRTTADGPWLSQASVNLEEIPAAPVRGEPVAPSTAQTTSMVDLAEDLVTYVESGKATGFAPGALKRLRADLLTPSGGTAQGQIDARVWGGSWDDPTLPGGPIRVQRTATGSLATIDLFVDREFQASEGFYLTASKSKAARLVYGNRLSESQVTTYFGITVAVEVSDGGKPKIIGAGGGEVLDDDQ